MGLIKYFLGIKASQSNVGIFTFQTKYANNVLKRFKMLNYKPTFTPMTTRLKLSKEDKGTNVDPSLLNILVGILMCLTTTRSDIMYAVSLI